MSIQSPAPASNQSAVYSLQYISIRHRIQPVTWAWWYHLLSVAEILLHHIKQDGGGLAEWPEHKLTHSGSPPPTFLLNHIYIFTYCITTLIEPQALTETALLLSFWTSRGSGAHIPPCTTHPLSMIPIRSFVSPIPTFTWWTCCRCPDYLWFGNNRNYRKY